MSDPVLIAYYCAACAVMFPFFVRMEKDVADGYRLGMFGAAGIATAVAFWPSIVKFFH
jgi:hypothetical protein